MDITIRNKRTDYDPLRSPSSISVQGKGPLYLKQRRSDYAVRASFEMQRYTQVASPLKPGCGVFLLFTYNDEHQPHFPLSDVPCFERDHISRLVKALKDKYTKKLGLSFSYLIGSEYGVDKKHTRRPHYHCLFMLDSRINPREFVEFCRSIWTGQSYGRKHQPWKYGNLGFMFPSPHDCNLADKCRSSKTFFKRDYIARDNGACAVYAAKYAVKSYGFYRDASVKSFCDTPLKRRTYKNCLPYLFTNHRFGFNMLQETSCDLVKGRVFDKQRNRWFNIPQYVLYTYLTYRVFKEYYNPVDEHDEVLCKSDGRIIERRRYFRRYTLRGMQVKCKRFILSVGNLSSKLDAALHLGYSLSEKMALSYKLFQYLPLTSLDVLDNGFTWNTETAEKLYLFANLWPHWDNNSPFSPYDNYTILDAYFTTDDWRIYGDVCKFMREASIMKLRSDYTRSVKEYNSQRCKNRIRGYETESIDDINAPLYPQELYTLDAIKDVASYDHNNFVKNCKQHYKIINGVIIDDNGVIINDKNVKDALQN